MNHNTHKRWSQEEIIIFKQIYSSENNEILSKKFNRSIHSINKLAKRLKIHKNKYWTTDEINKLNNIYPKTTFDNLEKIFNRPIQSIRMKASKLGLRKDNTIYEQWTDDEIKLLQSVYHNTHYKVLKTLFNRTLAAIKLKANNIGLNKSVNVYKISSAEKLLNNTLESMYWIGFILADGSVRKSNSLILTLAKKDLIHLQKIAKLLNCNIQHITPKSQFGRFPACKIKIMDNMNIPILREKYNIHPNKTINPPEFSTYQSFLTNDQILALLIGFIDGDGNIHKLKRKGAAFNIKLKNHSSWYKNLDFMRVFLCNVTNIESSMLTRINKNGYAELTISNNNIIKYIKNFIIANNLPILERKWDQIPFNIKYTREYDEKRNIIQLDMNFNIINIFESIHQARKQNPKWTKHSIIKCINNPTITRHGYYWKYQ